MIWEYHDKHYDPTVPARRWFVAHLSFGRYRIYSMRATGGYADWKSAMAYIRRREKIRREWIATVSTKRRRSVVPKF